MAHILFKKFFLLRSQNWCTTSPIGLKIWTILPNRNFEFAASWIAASALRTTWGERYFGEGQLRRVATLESGRLRSVVRWDTQVWSQGNVTSGGRVSARIPCGSKFWLDPSKLTGCRVQCMNKCALINSVFVSIERLRTSHMCHVMAFWLCSTEWLHHQNIIYITISLYNYDANSSHTACGAICLPFLRTGQKPRGGSNGFAKPGYYLNWFDRYLGTLFPSIEIQLWGLALFIFLSRWMSKITYTYE
jgi:hypothetical protein